MAASLNTITLEEFVKLAQTFCSRQRSLNDVWEMKTTCTTEGETSDAYLVKRSTISGGTEVADTRDEPACSLDDPAALPRTPLSAPIQLEYHAVYSHTYQVPVLYLTACHSNGQRLSLEEIWSLTPQVHHARMAAAMWSTLTEGEHPVTGTPFYFVHPCHTGQVMAMVMGHGEAGAVMGRTRHSEARAVMGRTGVDYLTSWLSMFGPLVGLELPLGTARACTQTDPPTCT